MRGGHICEIDLKKNNNMKSRAWADLHEIEITDMTTLVPNKRVTRIKGGGSRTNQKISITGDGGINCTLWKI